jgi:hypothetical protein
MWCFARSSIRSWNGLADREKCAWLAVALLSLTGCGPRFVRAPDSPLLILEAKGRVRVAAYDAGKLVDIGWIDAADLTDQTVVPYDWTEVQDEQP